jgi:hypothetical protein
VLVHRRLASLPQGDYARLPPSGEDGLTQTTTSKRTGGVSLTQTIKHRDEHERLLGVEIRTTIAALRS